MQMANTFVFLNCMWLVRFASWDLETVWSFNKLFNKIKLPKLHNDLFRRFDEFFDDCKSKILYFLLQNLNIFHIRQFCS